MLVRLAGECRVYGTVPAALGDVARGSHVKFVATVERSREDSTFGFFSRPTAAEMLS